MAERKAKLLVPYQPKDVEQLRQTVGDNKSELSGFLSTSLEGTNEVSGKIIVKNPNMPHQL